MEAKQEGWHEITMEEKKSRTPRMAKDERQWRNTIADEIKKEKDRVNKYYSAKGEMTPEQFVRINIFSLCETIARGGI